MEAGYTVCNNCGTQNMAGARNCLRCGSDLTRNNYPPQQANTVTHQNQMTQPYYSGNVAASSPIVQVPAMPVAGMPVIIGQKTNGMCTASLVLGILGLVFCWLPVLGLIMAVLAVIFGAAGIYSVNNHPEQGGKGMGIAGLVMGIVSLVPIIIFWSIVGSFLSSI